MKVIPLEDGHRAQVYEFHRLATAESFAARAEKAMVILLEGRSAEATQDGSRIDDPA